ncbi:MAG TPA: DMT family transporter [Myxococcota bacterium]|nr:DMT family transporter [Myxococcota bacterium]
MVSVQSGASIAKGLFPVLGASGVTGLRLSLAAAILVAVGRPWRHRLPRAAWLPIMGYGASLGCMNMCFYLALNRIPLGVTVALEFAGPLAVALASSKRPLDVLWAAMAASGILLLMPLHPGATSLDSLGVAYALAAAAGWACYIIFGQRASRLAPGGAVTGWGMCTGAALVAPVGLIAAGPAWHDASVLPLALAVAVLSSAIPYSLEMVALKRLPARTFGILMSLEPAVATVAGLTFLGERLSAPQSVAIALVMAASVGSATSARSPQPA